MMDWLFQDSISFFALALPLPLLLYVLPEEKSLALLWCRIQSVSPKSTSIVDMSCLVGGQDLRAGCVIEGPTSMRASSIPGSHDRP
ncbi:hypothetical protein BD414DRAFT_495913 [Trametes punicea]|nr:hypothetical protein BD414DRAFT_495913 [Trametes punicea]